MQYYRMIFKFHCLENISGLIFGLSGGPSWGLVRVTRPLGVSAAAAAAASAAPAAASLSSSVSTGSPPAGSKTSWCTFIWLTVTHTHTFGHTCGQKSSRTSQLKESVQRVGSKSRIPSVRSISFMRSTVRWESSCSVKMISMCFYRCWSSDEGTESQQEVSLFLQLL